MVADRVAITDDAILGGKLRLLQPKRGHRFGHDAILLAAAVDAKPGQSVVELGAGVGAASLALLARVPRLEAWLVEIEPALYELAAENIERNGFGRNARAVLLDVAKPARSYASVGMDAGAFHHVLMNPPFNDPSHQSSPDSLRRNAHTGSEKLLQTWLRAAARLLRPQGTVTLIWRADGLPSVLTALKVDYGAIAVLPIHPRPDQPAIRIIVRGTKGSHAPLALRPPLTLNDKNSQPAAEAEAVLRAGAGLRMA
jgi:tRNA1(Val) A37 N6-methylase TrmN6